MFEVVGMNSEAAGERSVTAGERSVAAGATSAAADESLGAGRKLSEPLVLQQANERFPDTKV